MNNFIINMPKKIHFNVSLPYVVCEILEKYSDILILLPMEAMNENNIVNAAVGKLKEKSKNVHLRRVRAELSDYALDKLFEDIEGIKADCILAVGGGSVLDAGKIISARYTNGGAAADYIDGKVSFDKKSLPLFLAPTTYSSSEATSSVVICSHFVRRFKTQIKNKAFIADEIIIDPDLYGDIPRSAALNSMMISFVALMEGYVSKNSNAFCDALISDCFAPYEDSIRIICAEQKSDAKARAQAAYSSVIASITKEHCGGGIVSALANAICSIYNIPYGAVCGSLMYHGTLRNMQKTQMFAPNSEATEKYSRLGSICSGKEYEYNKHAVLLRWFNDNLNDLRMDLKLPTLSQLGVEKDSFYTIVSNLKPGENPVEFAESELVEILEAAY